ncbi:hypothetical protein D3C78_1938990 [compost metagenome]
MCVATTMLFLEASQTAIVCAASITIRAPSQRAPQEWVTITSGFVSWMVFSMAG